MLPHPRIATISLSECDHCPWNNNPPKNVNKSVLQRLGTFVWGTVGARACGICGCQLDLKAIVAKDCPLEDRAYYEGDKDVQKWRRDKWKALEKDSPIYERLYERRFL